MCHPVVQDKEISLPGNNFSLSFVIWARAQARPLPTKLIKNKLHVRLVLRANKI